MKYKHTTGLRILAYVIDTMILGAIGGILSVFTDFGTVTQQGGMYSVDFDYLEMTVLYASYFLIFAIFFKGRTLGKLITKQQVLCADLSQITLGKLILREALKVLLWPISIISLLFVAIRKDKKSIHDILAATIVLKDYSSEPEFYQPDRLDQPVQQPEPEQPKSEFYE